MKITNRHEWNLSPREAIALQSEMAGEISETDELPSLVKFVAGIDLGYEEATNTCRAVVVVLKFPELELVEQSEAVLPISFPYVPGLLSFRETPAALAALEKLNQPPDLILCDGQGIAHPRRFGIACHIGVLTDVPTIGVAKSILVGHYENLGEKRGDTAELVYKKEIVGATLRTRDGVQPVYVSIGHKISLPTAVDYVFKCAPKYRLPETTRLADKLASYRKNK